MNDIKLMKSNEVKSYYDSSFTMPCYKSLEYKVRLDNINSLYKRHITKNVLELGAGKGYWIDSFIMDVESYTAVEIGKQNCEYLERKLSIYSKNIKIINDDVFCLDFKNIFASTLIFSFFISHFQNQTIIDLLKKIIEHIQIGNILVLDSNWSDFREKNFRSKDYCFQERLLPNGDIVKIPKRYIDENDIIEIANALNMSYKIRFWDKYWTFIQIFQRDGKIY
jgi:phospholipid N-methyltransferase